MTEQKDVEESRIDQENSQEELKQAIAGLLFAFKNALGDAQLTVINGVANNEEFTVAVALNEKAVELDKIAKESLISEK